MATLSTSMVILDFNAGKKPAVLKEQFNMNINSVRSLTVSPFTPVSELSVNCHENSRLLIMVMRLLMLLVIRSLSLQRIDP